MRRDGVELRGGRASVIPVVLGDDVAPARVGLPGAVSSATKHAIEAGARDEARRRLARPEPFHVIVLRSGPRRARERAAPRRASLGRAARGRR